MMRRKLTVITALAIAAGCIPAAGVGAAQIAEKTTVEYNEYYGLVAAVSDTEQFMSYDDEPVTRGDFIQALVSALDIGDRTGTSISFKDTESGSDVYNAVSAAVGAGLISDSDFFRPDENITINEVYKICVSACGYGIQAEYNGGWPEGYAAMGAQLGISNGVSGGNITCKDAYRIIFNTFEADYLEWDSDGYSKGEGNVLYAYRSITKITGTVTSNSTAATGSYADASIKPDILEGTIGIDYMRYNTYEDYDRYLGYSVKAYIADDEYDKVKVVYVCPKNDNREYTFKSNDIIYENGYISMDSKSSKHYNINKSAEIIYNGRADYDYNLEDINNVSGNIRVIDNNGDNKFDYVIIDDYYYMKVASFDKEELIIRDKTSAEKEINLDEDAKYTVYSEEDNDYVELSNIIQDTMLAVRRSNDQEIVDIIILGRILSGVISTYSSEEVYVDGKSYYLSDYFVENDYNSLISGKSVDFYLGINDEIVATSFIESIMQYGYLIKAYLDDSGEEMGIKLFSEKGEMLRLECADNIILNGTKLSQATVYDNISGRSELIRYGLDRDGKCKYIDTSTELKDYVDDTASLNEYNNLTYCNFGTNYYYRGSALYPYCNVQSTIMFMIPDDAHKSDDDRYAIGNPLTSNTNYTNSQIKLYNVGLDGTVDALVYFYDPDTEIANGKTQNFFFVEEANEEAVDGEIKTKVYGWEGGVFKSYYLNDSVSDVGIKQGDLINYIARNDEIISAVIHASVDFKNYTVKYPNSNMITLSGHDDVHYGVGSVYSYENGWMLLSNVSDGDGYYSYLAPNLKNVKLPDKVVVYNMKTKKLRTGSADDIKTYRNSGNDASYVLVEMNNAVSNFCIIYEK